MVHSFVGLHSLVRIPAETSSDEVEEGFVIAFESLTKRLARWLPSSSLGGDKGAGLVERIEKELFAGRLFDKMLFGRTENLHNARKLFLLIFTREYGIPGVELCEDTTQTPHVNGKPVAHAEDDFWGSIEPRLDISIY